MTTTHNGVPPVPAVDDPTDDALHAGLAQALRAVRLGRFDTRPPRGLSREVVEEFDALVALLERRNRDLLRIGRVVGREGRMLERLNEEAYDGAWAEGVHAVAAVPRPHPELCTRRVLVMERLPGVRERAGAIRVARFLRSLRPDTREQSSTPSKSRLS